MSVIVAKRNESAAQFITTAIELLNYTTRMVTKFPKKYTFYGLHHTYELAQMVVDDLIRANSLYFNTAQTDNFKPRQELFDKAMGNLNCLTNHLGYIKGLVTTTTITDKQWLYWGILINQTLALTRKIKDSDAKRLK